MAILTVLSLSTASALAGNENGNGLCGGGSDVGTVGGGSCSGGLMPTGPE